MILTALALFFAAQSAPSSPVVVVEVSGILDGPTIAFVIEAINGAAEDGAQAVIIQLDSPGVVDDEIRSLIDLVESPPLPVVVWVGEAPAVAYGGAAELFARASVRTAAPGVVIGHWRPLVVGEPTPGQAVLVREPVVVEGPVPGLVDEVQAALGQIVVWLDGQTVQLADRSVVLQTAFEEVAEDGSSRLRPTVEVIFKDPGAFRRLLGLSLRPESAFLFFVVGLSLVIFEFYALGPGAAAAIAVFPLLLGGYGMAQLPMRMWALALILGSFLWLTIRIQRGGFGVGGVLATGSLAAGGLFLSDAAPQITPVWWAIVLSAVFVGLFFAFAIPTAVKARFSTPTIGRDHLIGRRGVALSELAAEGVVEVGGARWRATAHREAGISKGDPVVVAAVDGLYLEVEPERENHNS